MKKERFLGHLEHIQKMVYEGYYEDSDTAESVINEVIELAEQLDEPIETLPTYPTYPTYPSNPWWDPYKPYVTWTTDKIELDNQSDFEYNGIRIKKDPTLPDPNDWSIEVNTPGPPNFTVVK